MSARPPTLTMQRLATRGAHWLAFRGEKSREDWRIFGGEIPPPEHENDGE